MDNQRPGGRKLEDQKQRDLKKRHLDQPMGVVIKCEGICVTFNAPQRATRGGSE